MKITTRGKKDYSSNWVQTATSIVALVFTVLVLTKVVTSEQATTAEPIIGTVLTGVSSVIAGVIALIGIFFKPKL